MKALSIRKVDQRLANALDRERRRRGVTLNETVLDLLRHALGISSGTKRSNGLVKLAGAWSAAESARASQHALMFEHLDDELWS